MEAIDSFEKGDLNVTAGLPSVAPYRFGLQQFEGAFDGAICSPGRALVWQ